MSIQPLVDNINKLNEAHLALIELSKQKTQAIIHNQINDLNLIVSKENKLLTQISELDKGRIQLMSEYLLARGYYPNPQITVTQLVKVMFKAEDKLALQGAQAVLSGTLHRLRDLNVRNKQLIEDALAYIDLSIDLFLGRSADEPFYGKPAENLRNRSGLNIFDTRA